MIVGDHSFLSWTIARSVASLSRTIFTGMTVKTVPAISTLLSSSQRAATPALESASVSSDISFAVRGTTTREYRCTDEESTLTPFDPHSGAE